MGKVTPDRVRLSIDARITVLKAIRMYVDSLLSKDKETETWSDAMDAWRIAKALAEREPGRRVRWGERWFYDFDASRPVKDIDGWIKGLARK